MKGFAASLLLLAAVLALYTESAVAQDVATLTAQVRMEKFVLLCCKLFSTFKLNMTQRQQLEPQAECKIPLQVLTCCCLLACPC
jgi:dihydroxyacetone kinase